ncbi:UbiH/UbiF/VisC/COQ6 family ubiquinone biosynthesis hydroxylase [Sandaracinobacter sp. RS1-74]|uniref:UbiH/UbiF/VisC/COQ6 family ubiquinone biosynthesis hydroxylase n=1 Tax=Sandaracinobacteroides sayramensis TaxID=2913411 RepID=UPI001EDAEBAD|nr:UbiH/UbiF/VisC/COQ6 family ubiquinone biosynthesis hydroxylase [Sandaracinobacteroides sayramensis]MCG2842216.1 UbiH/UbiF/VisC/COQ6 family ubiquinone biosynthesis hydroxylase [Sandaracinobacteroides sayramensis]
MSDSRKSRAKAPETMPAGSEQAAAREPLLHDALIVGGGLNGLTLALALAEHDLEVGLIERADPDAHLAPGFDGRVSAIASSSARMLRALGFGDLLDEVGCPIRAIRVTDGGDNVRMDSRRGAPGLLHFDSAEAEPAEPLGIMLENRTLRAALLERLRAHPRVRLYAPASIESRERGADEARIRLADGRELAAPVIVACDGRPSALRKEAGIRTAGWQYDATAIVTVLAHEKPHRNVASELFYSAGPFAQLPMNDLPDGRHRSALVWTVHSKDAEGVKALSPRAFAHEAEKRMGSFLGKLEVIAPVQSFPLNLQHAERYWANRLILVGDAAHGIHPIAGQGLNLGLRDVAALTEVLSDAARHGLDLGHPDVARRYERWRRGDNFTTAFTTDVLVRLFAIPGRPAERIRSTGLAAVNRLPFLRRAFMAIARGETGDRPPLLRGELG